MIRARLRSYAYSYGPDKQDEMRKKLVSAVDVFHDVRGMNDIQIVELARADKLDIAIDLERLYEEHTIGTLCLRFGTSPDQLSWLSRNIRR